MNYIIKIEILDPQMCMTVIIYVEWFIKYSVAPDIIHTVWARQNRVHAGINVFTTIAWNNLLAVINRCIEFEHNDMAILSYYH